ncbi:hypothetical protein V8G54_029227 [Vigna mungo]|uniref:RING-type E3 ubiquitin transferase n=1 Tax=Vigna mungo TaxID=3915 RepID=A0AAQ3RK48_VIGMU
MIPWGGLSCCLSAAALYLLGRSSGRDAEILKSVTRVNQLKELGMYLFRDLNPQLFENLSLLLDNEMLWFLIMPGSPHFSAQLLDAEILPLIVTISGRVGSETPINCEFSGLRGVIVEETAEQHFLKHNDAGSWIQDSALMLSMSKEVPWYLDDGSDRVHVVGARGATGFALPVGSEAFEESGRSLVRGTLDYLQGLKMLGVKRIERVLPIGTSLTVVGEAAKDDVGTIRIQRPHKGPFYVSPKTIDQLIANLGKWARWYKYASVGLTVFGAYLIAKHAIRYILERRRRSELQRKVLAAAAAKKSGSNNDVEKADSLSDVAKRDRLMPDLCVICLEQEYNAVFVPRLSRLSVIDKRYMEAQLKQVTWNEELCLNNPRATKLVTCAVISVLGFAEPLCCGFENLACWHRVRTFIGVVIECCCCWHRARTFTGIESLSSFVKHSKEVFILCEDSEEVFIPCGLQGK